MLSNQLSMNMLHRSGRHVSRRVRKYPVLLNLISAAYFTHVQLSNSHTIGCPPVRGDNPRALASGFSYVQNEKHGITILYLLHQCRHFTLRDISCLSW